MNWFKGEITEAILKCKQEKLIFLVYVHDENANEMSELWENEQVSIICNKECISLKLESTQDACQQFSQIYKVLCYPSTFLIGLNGMPIEIIAGSVNLETILEKLNKAIKAHKRGENVAIASNEVKLAEEPKPIQNAESPITEEQASTSEEAAAKKSIDERVAEAKEKIRLLQEKKAKEEEDKEKEREMERRKLGQDIVKAKQLKHEQELKKMADDLKKDRMQEELAKKKVLEQIQRDREDKHRKYVHEQEQVKNEKLQKKQLESNQEAARNSNIARIQFRFVDGSSAVETFEPDQAFSLVNDFIKQKLANQSFTVHTTFPKRVFGDEDLNKTLRDLQLAPSATLLVIPSKGVVEKTIKNLVPTSSSTVGLFRDVFSLVMLPFTIIWGLFSSFFGYNTAPQNSSSNENNQRQGVSQSSARSDATELRRRRIAGLHNNDDRNDDENATWNGNSTQQM